MVCEEVLSLFFRDYKTEEQRATLLHLSWTTMSDFPGTGLTYSHYFGIFLYLEKKSE